MSLKIWTIIAMTPKIKNKSPKYLRVLRPLCEFSFRSNSSPPFKTNLKAETTFKSFQLYEIL